MKKRYERKQWLDIARFVAILAVVIDHSKGFAYENPFIQRLSFFSVSLFILISGYGIGVSNEREKITFNKQWLKIKSLFVAYLIANFVGQILYEQEFVLSLYVKNVINFNFFEAYYYFGLYFQLIMIAPVLLNLCNAIFVKTKIKYALYIIVIGLLVLFSHWSIFHSNILNLYGGGGLLFGGTYIILYWLGIVIAKEGVLEKIFYRNNTFWFALLLILWSGWNIYNWKNWIDLKMSHILGNGVNPPGIFLTVSAIMVMSICYNLSKILESIKLQKIKYITRSFDIVFQIIFYIGQNTLYIFLYHIMARSLVSEFASYFGLNENILIKLAYIPGMIFIPLASVSVTKRMWNKIENVSCK